MMTSRLLRDRSLQFAVISCLLLGVVSAVVMIAPPQAAACSLLRLYIESTELEAGVVERNGDPYERSANGEIIGAYRVEVIAQAMPGSATLPESGDSPWPRNINSARVLATTHTWGTTHRSPYLAVPFSEFDGAGCPDLTPDFGDSETWIQIRGNGFYPASGDVSEALLDLALGPAMELERNEDEELDLLASLVLDVSVPDSILSAATYDGTATYQSPADGRTIMSWNGTSFVQGSSAPTYVCEAAPDAQRTEKELVVDPSEIVGPWQVVASTGSVAVVWDDKDPDTESYGGNNLGTVSSGFWTNGDRAGETYQVTARVVEYLGPFDTNYDADPITTLHCATITVLDSKVEPELGGEDGGPQILATDDDSTGRLGVAIAIGAVAAAIVVSGVIGIWPNRAGDDQTARQPHPGA